MELNLEGTQNAFPDLAALPSAITLFQFCFCFLLPVILSKGESLKNLPKSATEIAPYITLSLVVFGSTCMLSLSVRYVTFPMKVIFKSMKLIPTMLVSSLMQSGRHYGGLDYLAAVLLCVGAAGYGFGEATEGAANGNSSRYVGIMLLTISVCCDAVTPNIQQRLMAAPVLTIHPALSSTVNPSNCFIENSTFHRVTALVVPRGGRLGLSASTLMTNANFVGCLGVLCWMAVTGLLDDVSVMSTAWWKVEKFSHTLRITHTPSAHHRHLGQS
jgi:hypothetical protein